MKKSILASLLAVTLLFTVGCKKDDPEVSKGMTAKVEGNAWTAETVACVYSEALNLTQITGMKGMMAESIQLNFFGNTTGTYSVNTTQTSAIGSYVMSASAEGFYTTLASDSSVGQIVITEYDIANKLISGTFKFDVYNSLGSKVSITEGKFNKVALTVSM